ncbi:MAG: dTDP-glucose 4,6-dehydratase [Candidatus Magasanikbacteria bacterium RIFCSPLOWO2_12_FULL_47_9b]|nr:MAG: dTDP-glucose 4,6-dehydratase [Candidatus Magasanikbacteria bacterium RIFCSPLOWO2_02_FULL_47_16]OGH79746.1 MAG: dTDP-glucose 4,6-dehydratase [Candidatus Magasanikbacteria bacterium RIFCSPHIGHO2_02_FULL_48_18]OGH83077.1 MAG: dTDP-glucose 4,6-dehydratase [Candidatus Magasanikbacteria bacterium RIFCSPLOWO2_12_FULL_47_9b]
MRTILVTGGAGFIGSNFIHYWMDAYPEDRVLNVDLLTYAGNLENLKSVSEDLRYTFIRADITDFEVMKRAMQGVDFVVNFAAESHNDRAVLDPGVFVRTNVLGTQILLEAARQAGVKRFHHISTCEVFGDLALDEDRAFKEDDAYVPRTPYNASKAGANHEVMAYFHTYGMPVTISHCSNNYGPYQFPEKLIPLFTTNALEDKPLPLFKSSANRREWIHVDDHSRAIDMILQKGTVGEAYNIGTGVEKSIEDITDIILDALQKPESLKTYVPDRLGHDRRYLLDTSKIRSKLGWKPEKGFEEGIRETIRWYVDHREWWERVKSGAYQEYYKTYYYDKIGKQ